MSRLSTTHACTAPRNISWTAARAATHDDAMDILRGFGVTIRAGPEAAHSAAHQIALLTLVNCPRRTLLGGVEVIGVPDAPCSSARSRAHPRRRRARTRRHACRGPQSALGRFGAHRHGVRPTPAHGWR